MYIMVWSHPDLGHKMTRLARYTPVLSKVTFDALKHIVRYLYYHPHRRFVYPQMPMHSLHIICNNYDSPHFAKHKTTDTFAVFDDGGHCGTHHTQRSLSSVLVTLVV